MPQFTDAMLKNFNAIRGAYSEVTLREATGDKSVTLDANEKSVIYSIYSEETLARRGGAFSTNPAHKDFIVLYSDETSSRAELSIVHPKQKGNELRLYFKRGSFEANPGDIWFIFTKVGENIPYIGSMLPNEWTEKTEPMDYKGIAFKEQLNLDDEDEIFQREVGAAAVKLPKSTSTLKYPRDPKVALNAFRSANFLCEGNPEHETFESITEKPYMEAHHLIPISLQGRFNASLDVSENIACLCPGDHRLLHYGVGEKKIELLNKLWNAKKDGLKRRQIDISYEDLLAIYIISKD